MTLEEALLREACARAAQEEADQLERQLTDGESREAEALFARHRKEAFQVIARHTAAPSSRRWSKALRAAACLLILGAGVFAALRTSRPPQETPLSGLPSPSVAPYYTPKAAAAPSDTAVPASVPTEAPNDAGKSSIIPTSTPNPTIYANDMPTETPKPEEEPTPSPSEPPIALAPDQWTGRYFPQSLPADYVLSLVTQENGSHTAAYAWEERELVFTEYDEARSVSLPSQAEKDYVQLPGGLIALRLITDEGVTLAWDVDGRTLTLFGEEADVLAIAGTVVRLR